MTNIEITSTKKPVSQTVNDSDGEIVTDDEEALDEFVQNMLAIRATKLTNDDDSRKLYDAQA